MIDALNAVAAVAAPTGADKVASATAAPAGAKPGDSPGDPSPSSGSGKPDASAHPSAGQSPSEQTGARVQIDRNGAQGYVYRLIDTSSGRVIVEAPQEGLEQLTSHPAYAAGALVSTSA